MLKKISIPHEKKIKQKDYLSQGTIPVIDQGETFIGGYTNDANTILKCPFPVIVFGDHTKTIKLVNFDFAPGADGIKVLKPTEQYDIRFFFYAMQYVTGKMQDRGYSRNYQYLEKELIPTFSLSEQKRIVEKIDELFSDLDAAEAELLISQKKLDIYRTSLLTLASEGFPLTEKNSTLSSWKRVKIENILSDSDKGMTTGPFGTMLPKKDHRKEGIPVLGIENIGNGIFVDGNKIFIDIEKARELKSFQVAPDDIIISRSGTVGKLCVVPSYVGEAYLSTNLIRIKLNKKKIIPQFFVYFFLSKGIVWEQIKELCKGSTRPFLNQTILKSIDFPLPSLDDQIRILNIIESKFSICDVLQKQIAESIIKSKALRNSILKQAFEGGLV